jgi:hypothetical protein
MPGYFFASLVPSVSNRRPLRYRPLRPSELPFSMSYSNLSFTVYFGFGSGGFTQRLIPDIRDVDGLEGMDVEKGPEFVFGREIGRRVWGSGAWRCRDRSFKVRWTFGKSEPAKADIQFVRFA